MDEEQEFMADAQRMRDEQVAGRAAGGTDPAGAGGADGSGDGGNAIGTGVLADGEIDDAEAERLADPDEFLAEAKRVREDQVAAAGGHSEVDPAVQAAVDQAQQTPAQETEEPGLGDIGGLSTADIEAQQQNIAEEHYRGQ